MANSGQKGMHKSAKVSGGSLSPDHALMQGILLSPISLEPFPNGGFINIGAYGGTPEASKSYFGEPVCETIVAGDINGDCQANRADLEIMALHWKGDEPLLPEPCR